MGDMLTDLQINEVECLKKRIGLCSLRDWREDIDICT